ncbi:MAG: hypothetical protein E7373_00715 [Clostridiales bacterium]|nr:hypothetical protein [Clostridiales bacterium]
MDFVFLKDFLSDYSLPTLIISSIVAIISLVLDKFLSEKLPVGMKNYIPFGLAIIAYFIYDMIFVCFAFSFRTEAIGAGILCGSLSTIVVSIAGKIKKGEPIPLNATTLLIEKLLEDYVSKESAIATALIIEELIESSNKEKGDSLTKLEIYEALKKQSEINLSDQQYYYIAGLILSSVKELNKNKV